LDNSGTGRNLGVELTLEKFFSNNYYFLVTGSFFDSKYTDGQGRTFNTAFNTNYVVNALVGAEWPIGKKKQHALFGDIKFALAGGNRTTPVDVAASDAANQTIFNEEESFTQQLIPYHRLDIKTGVRFNHKKVTQEWSVTIQNVYNRENLLRQTFDANQNEVINRYQIGLFPIVQYKLLF